jgi:uncharacterized protein (TIGR03790 family)
VFRLLAFFLAVPLVVAQAELPAPPPAGSVAVIYNSAMPESKKLAETYAAARSIPEGNLIGLRLTNEEDMSRADFDKTLKGPLIEQFDSRGLWKREKDAKGNLAMVQAKIRIIVCMRGVPDRIKHDGPVVAPGPKEQPFVHTNEAAVDSELTTLAAVGLPLDGPLDNPYYKKDVPFLQSNLPIFLAGRIDGPSWEVCERMIRDAVATEKTGLWGMATVDLSKKYPEGDSWLDAIVKQNLGTGIPTLVDRFPDTLPTNYPLKDAALYFGWYDWNVSGPFLNPNFKFRPGAVAVHIHSFSAAQLRNPQQNWCGPLLDRGAAATLGNVYEPYLPLTHHLDIFEERLLKGYTLIEAAYMAMPVLSWQGIVLGDPLYRPFLHLDGSGEKTDTDRDYRAFRMATDKWSSDNAKREEMLHEATNSLHSGVLAESMGLSDAAQGLDGLAMIEFENAKKLYTAKTDLLRMDLHLATLQRNTGTPAKIKEAIQILKDAKQQYGALPESAAATGWLNILDPPAPPPAKPK